MRKLLQDRSGNVAITFGVLSLVAASIIGGSLDWLRMSKARETLQAAADSAALAGLIQAKNSTSGGTATADDTAAQTTAESQFTKAVASMSEVSNVSRTSTIAADTQNLTSTLAYSATVSTMFARIAGLQSYTVAGSAKAASSLGLPTYVDIHFVIDTSHSMAIGATATDQATMLNSIGCTIACHMVSGTNTVATARKAGATLRLDVVKSAIATILTKAKTMQAASIAAGNGSTIRVAFHTFSNTLSTPFAISSDLSAASTALAAIDIDATSGQTGTNYHAALTSLTNLTMPIGDGKTATTPKAYVVLMTDGIEDSAIQATTTNSKTKTTTSSLTRDGTFVDYSPYHRDTSHGFNWDIQGFDPSLCTAVKARGLNLMTLNVEYLIPTLSPDSSESRYLYIKNTLKSKIQTNMASCATSSDMALYASTSADITTAVDTLFRLATQTPIYLAK